MGRVTEYEYDVLNRLKKINYVTGSPSSEMNLDATYTYDALGRWVRRFIAENLENTNFTYDGEDVILDDANGTLTRYQNAPASIKIEPENRNGYKILPNRSFRKHKRPSRFNRALPAHEL